MPARDIQFGVGPVILAAWINRSGLIWCAMRRRPNATGRVHWAVTAHFRDRV